MGVLSDHLLRLNSWLHTWWKWFRLLPVPHRYYPCSIHVSFILALAIAHNINRRSSSWRVKTARPLVPIKSGTGRVLGSKER